MFVGFSCMQPAAVAFAGEQASSIFQLSIPTTTHSPLTLLLLFVARCLDNFKVG